MRVSFSSLVSTRIARAAFYVYFEFLHLSLPPRVRAVIIIIDTCVSLHERERGRCVRVGFIYVRMFERAYIYGEI